MMIPTTKGDVDLSELEVKDSWVFENDKRVMATEYWHQGELVRRDVWVNVFKGESMGARGQLG